MNTTPELGKYHALKVKNKIEEGWVLQAGNRIVFLPNEEAPAGLNAGEILTVILYLNAQNEMLASTKQALGEVGQNVWLKIIKSSEIGAFLDWGLPKDLFLPRSKQVRDHEDGEEVYVKIFYDEFSNRIACSELFEDLYNNKGHELTEKEIVELELLKKTDLGYQMIINGKYLGLLYSNEVFKPIKPGEIIQGYVKKIKDNDLIDLAYGKPGYSRVGEETFKIFGMLKDQGGFLPYHDKTDADEIYKVFGMSKKTFKMSIGTLFKQKKINITNEGIEIVKRTFTDNKVNKRY